MLSSPFKNSANLFLSACLLIALQLFAGTSVAQSVIYSQDFGAVGSAPLPAGWVASGPVASNISLNTTDPSMGYIIDLGSSASGGAQLEDGQGTPAIGTAYVTVSGVINTVGYTSITVQYAAYSSSSNIEDPALAWSTDGITWNPLTTDGPAAGSVTWTLVNASPIYLPAGAAGHTNLQFRFTFVRTNTNGSYRIDDFTVEGIPCGLPVITGTPSVTVGATTTLSDAFTGGTWSADDASVATIGSASGIVSGASPGTSSIVYTMSSGCTVGVTVTVYAVAGSPITGIATVCPGSSAVLSDASAGAWSSGAAAIATVNASGDVYGVSPGTSVITFTYTGGGSATATVTVNPLPVAGTITGSVSLCVSHKDTLADTAPSGTWRSSGSQATVSGGVVSGISPGTDTIFYIVTNVCGADTADHIMTVENCISAVKPIPGSADGKITVSPNPNDGTFTISVFSNTGEQVNIIITNLLGEQIKQCTIPANHETAMQLNSPPGIYFLTTVTPQGTRYAKVIVR